MGVILQVVLLWDVAAMFLTDILFSKNLEMGAYPEQAGVMASNRVIVIGLWVLSVGLVYFWSRKHELFTRMFPKGDRALLFLASMIAIGLHFLVSFVMVFVANESLTPQGIGEHAFFVGMYGSVEGTIVFGLQCLYYVFESLIVVFMIGLFQRAGDQLLHRQYIPWGGIGLTLTWGLIHFLMYPSLEMLAMPLSMGIIYLIGGKHIVPVFLSALLVFLI